MAINAVGMALAYASHVLFAKWLGLQQYGYYVYALAWLNVLCIVAQMGFNTSTIRITAELRAQNSNNAIFGLSAFSTQVVLFAGTIILVFGGTLMVMVSDLIEQDQIWTLSIMLPLVVALSLLYQRMAMLQGYEHVAHAQSYLEIVRPVLLIAVMAALTQFMTVNAPVAMMVNLAVTAVTFVAAAISVNRLMNVVSRATVQREFRSREWLSVSLPYLAIGGLTVVMQQSDVLMLGTMLGGVAVGLYVPALKLSQLILFPMLAIRSRAAPQLARLFAENNLNELQRQMNITTLVSGLTGLVLVIALIWQRETVLSLFGAEFIESAPAVVVLTLGMGMFALTGGVEVFLIFGPFERVTMLIYALVLSVNIVLNLILIPSFGFLGAAYATTATVVLRGIISTYVVWRFTGILPWRSVEAGGHRWKVNLDD